MKSGSAETGGKEEVPHLRPGANNTCFDIRQQLTWASTSHPQSLALRAQDQDREVTEGNGGNFQNKSIKLSHSNHQGTQT